MVLDHPELVLDTCCYAVSAWSWVNSDSSRTHVIWLFRSSCSTVAIDSVVLPVVWSYSVVLHSAYSLCSWLIGLMLSFVLFVLLINWAHAISQVQLQSWPWFSNCCSRLMLLVDLHYLSYTAMVMELKAQARRIEKSINETERWVCTVLFLQERDY